MKAPAFYATKTLLGGKPDVNRRTIWAHDTDTEVKTFNRDMRPWTPEMQRELEAELAALNEIAAKGGK